MGQERALPDQQHAYRQPSRQRPLPAAQTRPGQHPSHQQHPLRPRHPEPGRPPHRRQPSRRPDPRHLRKQPTRPARRIPPSGELRLHPETGIATAQHRHQTRPRQQVPAHARPAIPPPDASHRTAETDEPSRCDSKRCRREAITR